MSILVDPPRWPARGRMWSHLISDHNLDELHEFASRHAIPHQAFDVDHYDVPESAVAAMIADGALLVSSSELTRRLIASGLRVTMRERRGR